MDAAMSLNKARALLCVAALACLGLGQGARGFQYDIWFKYPHPHTVSEPVNYCVEPSSSPGGSGAASAAGKCQSTLPIYVNTLDSPKTLIPYTVSQLIDFCSLAEAREFEHSSHTEWDDNIRLAPFQIKFNRNEECKMLCTKSYKMSSHSDLYRLEELKLGLTRDYYHHWFTDTFPFSWCYKSASGSLNSVARGNECFIGFPIGYATDERGLPLDEHIPIGNFTKRNALFLFNHFDLTVYYESGEGKLWAGKLGGQLARITTLRVAPRSIDHDVAFGMPASATATGSASGPANKCSYARPPLEIPSQYAYGLNNTLSVSFSYSVRFVEDEPSASWQARWLRLESSLPNTSRGAWVLGFAIVVLVASVAPFGYALARTLLADRKLAGINPGDEQDNVAWRQLAGDIFREPSQSALFAVLVGSGCQFVASVVLSELFSTCISLFSATLLVIVVLLFVLVHGFVGGYAAVRLYATFGGDRWRSMCCLVSLLNPLVVFCLLVMSRNLLLLYNGSLMALNVGLFGSLVMVGLCFALSLPSALAGGSVAFRAPAIEFPVRPTANKRQVIEPEEAWKGPYVTTMLTALVPLFCFWCVESYPFYDSGGYIITVITILIVIMLSVSHCYFHLSQFDYRWWWRSYLACGLAAIYYFVHCAGYIFANLYVDNLTNALLYLSFAFFICLALFLLTGTIGFIVTFAFLWQTYSRSGGSSQMNYAMFQKSVQME